MELSGALAAFALTLLLAIIISVSRNYYLKRSQTEWLLNLRHSVSILIFSGITTAILNIISIIDTIFIVCALIIAITLCFSLVEACNAAALHFFNESVFSVYRHLPVSLFGRDTLKSTRAYFRQYFPGRYFLWTFLLTLAYASIGTTTSSPASAVAGGAAIAFLGLGLRYFGPAPERPSVVSPVEQLYLLADAPDVKVYPLADTARNALRLPQPYSYAAPKTIILVILESAGAYVCSSRDPQKLLSGELAALSGDPKEWIIPSNVVTNSSCTDVSVPSIVTGCGAHESIEKLHKLPLIFDLAKARSYNTAFFTSSSLKWANFDKFFQGSAIDKRVTGDTIGLPFINDVTVDDYEIAEQAADWIANQTGGILAVIYFNALHVPFQSVSKCNIPSELTVRQNKAAYVIEECHKLLFNALRISGRYDDALIFSVGDHGETLGYDGSDESGRMARTIKLTPHVLHPLFIMKPPANLPNEMRLNLQNNQNCLLASVDIAPSIADVLYAGPDPDLKYAGHSLFQKIPKDRIIYTLSINEWRSWSKGAVAISQAERKTIIDYQTNELCLHIGPGYSDSDRVRGGDRDQLLAVAFSEHIVRSSISVIFKQKLGYGGVVQM
ncbi:hypothetical protein LDDCCGHA_1676 [Methylobacterium oxalidis]|nr:hypothetical protein LDDCCGHA_1676 [Methylobacterium oxalidis]